MRYVADELLDRGEGAEQEVQRGDQALVLLGLYPAQGVQVQKTTPASHEVRQG